MFKYVIVEATPTVHKFELPEDWDLLSAEEQAKLIKKFKKEAIWKSVNVTVVDQK